MSTPQTNARRLLTAIALVAPTIALAYPIPPAPLWQMVEDAQLIVVATVESVEDPPPAPPNRDSDGVAFDADQMNVAKLHVREFWKGESSFQIAVPFHANMVCPAPPSYKPGETVLAFLGSDPSTGGWLTVHLSYGTRYVSPADLPIVGARVREALAIQKRKHEQRIERIEWLVRCAEHSVTRWDGLYELNGSRKPRAFETDELRIPPSELLTDEHRARIAHGFILEPEFVWTIPAMLEVLGAYKDQRLDAALIAAIDKGFEADPPNSYALYAAIEAVLERTGVVKHAVGLPKAEDLLETPDLDALRKAWVDGKAAMKR